MLRLMHEDVYLFIYLFIIFFWGGGGGGGGGRVNTHIQCSYTYARIQGVGVTNCCCIYNDFDREEVGPKKIAEAN